MRPPTRAKRPLWPPMGPLTRDTPRMGVSSGWKRFRTPWRIHERDPLTPPTRNRRATSCASWTRCDGRWPPPGSSGIQPLSRWSLFVLASPFPHRQNVLRSISPRSSPPADGSPSFPAGSNCSRACPRIRLLNNLFCRLEHKRKPDSPEWVRGAQIRETSRALPPGDVSFPHRRRWSACMPFYARARMRGVCGRARAGSRTSGASK